MRKALICCIPVVDLAGHGEYMNLIFLHVPLMLRSGFDVGWVRAVASTLVYLPAFFLAHMTYRFIQLVLVLSMI